MDTSRKPKIYVVLVSWRLVLVAVAIPFATAFTTFQGGTRTRSNTLFFSEKKNHRFHPHSALFLSSSDSSRDHAKDAKANQHPMADTSFLSHVMLKVPSVDKTVAYWTEKGGKIRLSRVKDENATNGDVELLSAFVELGCAKGSKSRERSSAEGESSAPPPVCFALELVSTSKSPDSYSIGNSISYIGVSMLLQFQNNLLGAITGEESPESQGDEPNGISVKSAASAPGDFLARLALKSNNLEATQKFYTTVLGMEVKAEDETMVCLRYDNDCFTGGVPTTLLFDAEKGEINVGDCFDHFAIATSTAVDEIYSRLQGEEQCKNKIFMKPTSMFGKEVMGVMDPNGYKVIIAST